MGLSVPAFDHFESSSGTSAVKVVINAYSARQGGGQTYLINLLANLPSGGAIVVEVFAPRYLKLPLNLGIRRVETRWPTENPLMRALWERFALPKYLKRTRADALFCPGGLVVTEVPEGCRAVTMFRNMTPFDPVGMGAVPFGLQRLRLRMLRRLMLASMRKADLTIFISEHARKVIERLAYIPNPLTIPHGVADCFRGGAAAPSRPAAAGSEPYLLYVSKLDNYKHHQEVVTAFSMLPEGLKASHRLLLIGEAEGKLAERVRKVIRERGLVGRVLMLGSVPYSDLPAFYLNSKANIFASSCENCPNIMLEALASGRPLLSSDVDPMPEFGGPDIGYFSPFEPRSIAASMRMVLEDDSVSARWARAAQERGSRYDWSRTARDTWRAILNLKRDVG